MKFAWKGDPTTREPMTHVFGTEFPDGEPVDVSGLTLEQQRKLAANHTFAPADKEAQELAATPRPAAVKAVQGASAGDLAAVWKRLEAVEKDNDTLRKAVAELAPLRGNVERFGTDLASLRGSVEALATDVEELRGELHALVEPAEPSKPVQGPKGGK